MRGNVTKSLLLAICLLVCVIISLLAESVESDAANLCYCILQLKSLKQLEVQLLVTLEVANL
jgi:hypothetical protein